MPAPVHRQPWFWAAAIAAVVILGFAVMIGASGPDRRQPAEVNVVAPAPAAEPPVIPVPAPSAATSSAPATSSTPAPPVMPERPEPPAKTEPAPKVVKVPTPVIVEKKTVVVREKAVPVPVDRPVPVPSPPGPASDATKAPASVSSDMFLNTGLPREARFQDIPWRAAVTVTVEDPAQLKEVGPDEQGTTWYARSSAAEPYDRLLVAVPDEEGKYVEYRRK